MNQSAVPDVSPATLEVVPLGGLGEIGLNMLVLEMDGSAIVIHQQPDDQRTDPSGNSGDRVLCGQLVAGPTNSLLRP